MSFKAIVSWAAQGALKAAGVAVAGPLGDVGNGFDAVVTAIAHLRAKQFSFADVASVLNAIQNILVDAGVEPKIVAEAMMIAGGVIPLLVDAYRAAGIDPFKPAPRTGPPLTQGDWSGATQDNDADNPSGEIGGPNADAPGPL